MMVSHEITVLEIFLDRYYLTVKPVCQTAATLNVELHRSDGFNALTVKCFRRRVWETRHSVASGWELLTHFSDVWCSSLLELTRNCNWQRERLFLCQMWLRWMYVLNIIIRKENKSRFTWFHSIIYMTKIKLPLWYSIAAKISHCQVLNCERLVKFFLPQRTVYHGFNLVTDTKNSVYILAATFLCN